MYFSSDQHFGHKNVIKYCSRPYGDPKNPTEDSVQQMNADLIKRHNEIIRPDDTVFYVGDFSLASGWVDTCGPLLQGKKFLIPGNHDWCHPCHSRKPQKMRQSANRFKNVGIEVLETQHTLTLDTGEKLLLCHLPYWEDDMEAYEARYQNFRPPVGDEYALICGHVHQHWKIRKHPSGKIMYNVGVDVHDYRPVSIQTIMKEIREAYAE